MRYTWTCETKTLIEALEKRGYKKIGHDLNENDYGTFFFSKTDKIEELNNQNLIIVKRRPTHTRVAFPDEFDEKEISSIHYETTKEVRALGFAPHWAILLQNKKTNEYKFLCLQPMFIMGILVQLGVFDYSHAISKLKFNKKDSPEINHKKLIEYLKTKKFRIETQVAAKYNISNSKGSIKYQIEELFGKDWQYLGPEKQLAKVEQEFYDNWEHMEALLEKAREIFGHDVSDQEKIESKVFNYYNSQKLHKEFEEFFKKTSKKIKDAKRYDCLKKFEEKIGFQIPLFVQNDWEKWETEEKTKANVEK